MLLDVLASGIADYIRSEVPKRDSTAQFPRRDIKSSAKHPEIPAEDVDRSYRSNPLSAPRRICSQMPSLHPISIRRRTMQLLWVGVAVGAMGGLWLVCKRSPDNGKRRRKALQPD